MVWIRWIPHKCIQQLLSFNLIIYHLKWRFNKRPCILQRNDIFHHIFNEKEVFTIKATISCLLFLVYSNCYSIGYSTTYSPTINYLLTISLYKWGARAYIAPSIQFNGSDQFEINGRDFTKKTLIRVCYNKLNSSQWNNCIIWTHVFFGIFDQWITGVGTSKFVSFWWVRYIEPGHAELDQPNWRDDDWDATLFDTWLMLNLVMLRS